MKLHTVWIIGLAASIVGCAEREQAASEQASDPEPAAVTEAPAIDGEAASARIEELRNSAFLDHMHAHAEHLDELNFALDDGELDKALTPAYWLSQHQPVSGIPEDLQPFVDSMREAARAVEAAEDLETARAAADRISTACQGCHAAMGVVTE